MRLAVPEEAIMKNTKEETKAKGGWWKGLWGQLTILLSQIFFAIVLTGMVLYLVAQYKMEKFQPFELATVAGLLGGFPLIAAFGEKIKDEGIKKRLKTMGGLYIFAAICFVVFGFYQAADMAGLLPTSGAGVWIFKVVYIVTFYGGALALIFAMWTSLAALPQLMGLGGVRDRFRKIFGKRDKTKVS
jgi:hypothetical protein